MGYSISHQWQDFFLCYYKSLLKFNMRLNDLLTRVCFVAVWGWSEQICICVKENKLKTNQVSQHSICISCLISCGLQPTIMLRVEKSIYELMFTTLKLKEANVLLFPK